MLVLAGLLVSQHGVQLYKLVTKLKKVSIFTLTPATSPAFKQCVNKCAKSNMLTLKKKFTSRFKRVCSKFSEGGRERSRTLTCCGFLGLPGPLFFGSASAGSGCSCDPEASPAASSPRALILCVNEIQTESRAPSVPAARALRRSVSQSVSVPRSAEQSVQNRCAHAKCKLKRVVCL